MKPPTRVELKLFGLPRMDYDLNQEVTLVLVDSSLVFRSWADVDCAGGVLKENVMIKYYSSVSKKES